MQVLNLEELSYVGGAAKFVMVDARIKPAPLPQKSQPTLFFANSEPTRACVIFDLAK